MCIVNVSDYSAYANEHDNKVPRGNTDLGRESADVVLLQLIDLREQVAYNRDLSLWEAGEHSDQDHRCCAGNAVQHGRDGLQIVLTAREVQLHGLVQG
jgi:hypothetical protein